MDVLAFDQSKRMTGWARWSGGMPLPVLGSTKLGGDYSSRYDCFLSLQKLIHEQFQIGTPDMVFWETPRNGAMMKGAGGRSNWETQQLNIALENALGTYCTVKRPQRFYSVDPDIWFTSFCTGMTRRTKRADRLDVIQERARQFGLKPKNADEAAAFGILDHALGQERVIPPWRQNHLLTEPLQLKSARVA